VVSSLAKAVENEKGREVLMKDEVLRVAGGMRLVHGGGWKFEAGI
jgi:hypothetical protein